MRLCVCLVLICVLLPAGRNKHRPFQECCLHCLVAGLCQCSMFFAVCSLGAQVFHLLGCKSWHLHRGVALPVPVRPLLHDHRWIDPKFFPFKWTFCSLLFRGDRGGGVVVMKRKAKRRTWSYKYLMHFKLFFIFLMSFQWLKAWSPKSAWGATCAIEFIPMGSGAALGICVTEQHTLQYLPLCFWRLLPSLHSWFNLHLHPCSFFLYVLVLNASSMCDIRLKMVDNLHGNI